MITRRAALFGMLAAPVIVRASSLMSVVPIPAAFVVTPLSTDPDMLRLAELTNQFLRAIDEAIADQLAFGMGVTKIEQTHEGITVSCVHPADLLAIQTA